MRAALERIAEPRPLNVVDHITDMQKIAKDALKGGGDNV